MIRLLKSFFLCGLMFFTYLGFSEENVKSIEEYNEKLPFYGVSWKSGSYATGGSKGAAVYYPSFYTGFAPRQEVANRNHIRLARGNQTRFTAILDADVILDYLYDLKTRANLYKELLDEGYINIAPRGAGFIPHVSYFQSLVSENVPVVINKFETGQLTKEDLYVSSLAIMKKLNPGRVFDISINLADSFLSWRDTNLSGTSVTADSNTQDTMTLVAHMLWGRVNLTRRLTASELGQLKALIQNQGVLSNESFVKDAYKLFKSITDGKYDFKTLDKTLTLLVDAAVCTDLSNCRLDYAELSAIYPTGTLKATTRDDHGNRISKFATPGLHTFIDSGSRGDVDHIRSEGYYGFAPKMDFEGIGNGFHNPAVRVSVGRSSKDKLRIPRSHNNYWPVKRGGVSHGCERLPLGHVWEMRNRLPVKNSAVKEVYYFGNGARDFDVFDIDADGTMEIMGVKYYIKYKLNGDSGLAKRAGSELELNTNVFRFYESLYGKNSVFEENDTLLEMVNPSVSIQTVNDIWEGQASFGKERSTVKSSYTFTGVYSLYEQNYEQDKVQFYTSRKIRNFNGNLGGGGKYSLSKRFVRLLGRVKGCAPFSNKETCGAAAYETEKAQIFQEIR